MSSSSSEEELDPALKESANCDYINKLVNNVEVVQPKPNATRSEINGDIDSCKETKFQVFLAQRLANRLEGKLEIVNRSQKQVENHQSSGKEGIMLFTASPIVAEFTEVEKVMVQTKVRRKRESNVNYEARAEEAAVSSDWIEEESKSIYLKDHKKPRIVHATLTKKLDGGRVECVIVNN